jgi:HSP20 family protein
MPFRRCADRAWPQARPGIQLKPQSVDGKGTVPSTNSDFCWEKEMRMTEAGKVPEKTGENANGSPAARRPFETLRREVDRIFDEFGGEFWRSPFRRSGDPMFRRELTAGNAPAVDIVEKDNAFEVTADVPGFDDKSIEVQVVNGSLWIKGERKSEKEERQKGYHLSEREFGSFQRCFRLPDGIDTDNIEATLKQGVLMVTLPKTADAQKVAKKIDIKEA